MKLILVVSALTFVCGDKLDRTYLPPLSAQTSGGSSNFLQTPNYSGSDETFQRNSLSTNSPTTNSVITNQFRNQFDSNENQPITNAQNFRSTTRLPNRFNSNENRLSSGQGTNNYGNRFDSNEYQPLSRSQNNYERSNSFINRFNNQEEHQIPSGPNNIGRNNNFAGRPSSLQASTNSNDDNVVINAFDDFSSDTVRPERPQASFEKSAAILRQDNQNNGETYSYSYETENGIYAEESAVTTNGVQAQGGFSFTGDDGQVYSIRYTADENGFVPQGDHLPTPPPVPEEILRALEKNAADEAAGIFDDGSYDPRKYGGSNDGSSQEFNYDRNNNNGFSQGGNDDSITTHSAAYLPPLSRPEDQRRQGNNQIYNDRTGFRGNEFSRASTRHGQNPQQSGFRGSFGVANRQSGISNRNGYQY